MPRRITHLTPEQTAAMHTHADKWINIGWSTEPANWDLFTDAAKRCYHHANIPWHNNVIQVPSPIVLSLAAPTAAYLIALHKDDASAVSGVVRGVVGDAVHGAVHDAVGSAVDGAVDSAVDSAVHDAVSGAVGDVVHGAVRDAVGDAVHGAVRDAVGSAVDGAVDSAVHDAVSGAVRGAVRGAVGDVVHGAVGGVVGGVVDSAVHSAVGGAVGDAVRDAVSGVVGDAVRDAVSGAVDSAVDSAVNSAVSGAVGRGVLEAIGRCWNYRLWGNLWTYWQAYNSYFRDECDLQLDGDMWDRSAAYEDTAKAAGWWWPHREFVMVCDRPRVLHIEQAGPRGWGSHRMHCPDGPAIAWADGYALHYWHGVRVPADLIEGAGWDTARILREPNAEIRRCAIERMGWDRFVVDARLTQVGATRPDPGNPGHTLALYDVPEQIYDEPIRVLICDNATQERDGTRRRFGLTVPASVNDPVAAAAWTFGLDPSQYAQLAHAS